MLGGGKDRSWLRPLKDGSVDTLGDPELEGLVGCHQGRFMRLNVPAQPGFEYIWENRKDIDNARLRGGIRVKAEDPEAKIMFSLSNDPDANEASQIDSYVNFNDVTLFKYPIETIRRIRNEESSRAQAMMRGGAAEYADRASAIERQMSRGLDTRFRRADHSMRVVDNADNTIDEWRPEDGLIREG